MLTTDSASRFLAQPRITVVGASDAKDSFGGAVYRALKAHGHDVVPVHPTADRVDGDQCYPYVGAVPGSPGGVLIMLKAADAVPVVRACIAAGVRHVWLFKGVGGAGAMSDEAVELCRAAGVDVVEGACPLMFLEPVGLVHKIHRGLRRMNRSLTSAA